ncbi:MAG: DUF4173 domain-containing protein [Lentimicrobiaceae bacterium]|nr:DUF4173 domain-containing protein [Lentimicrobiaceae bacterium]MCB9023175.1 DUF4173 domain-containing protein [Lentimicrobiaceae bacterium]MCO5265407.1 DUF4173 domain-containing protein [Lentimicrobium sp.]
MKKFLLLFPFAFALVFVYLFMHQPAGVNVLLFNVMILGGLLLAGRLNFMHRIQLLLVTGTLLSSVMVLFYGASMALAVNIISLILLAGMIASPGILLLLNGFPAFAYAVITGPFAFLKTFEHVTDQASGGRKFIRFALTIIIPLIILIVFLAIYASASPYFNRLTGNILQRIVDIFENIARFVSPAAFWLAVAGLLIAFTFLFGRPNTLFTVFGEKSGMDLLRKRSPFSGRFMALKTEYRSGVIMLLLLNLLIAVMNMLDVYYVWFFFEWNGQYLKQFVHEGTWLLIVSILISIMIVLYFFRANLNFFPGRKLILSLAGLWLAQNALLAVSVGVRNFWYIQHFNLAYKRIGVYAFLLLTIVGLITVFLKIQKRKSHQYLLHYNAIAAYVLLIGLGLFNWDKVIATYNVRHADKAFFHPEFMSTLSSSTLPVLQLSVSQMDIIEKAQVEKFDFYHEYMTLDYYKERVDTRCRDFIKGYPMLSWQGWNLADFRAFRELNSGNKALYQHPE